MATTNIRFLHQETTIANISNVQNTQSFILSENDGDLSYRMFGYVDGAGTARRLLAKDEVAKVDDLYLTDTDHSGTNLVRIIHASDADTYIEMQSDLITFHAGGLDAIEVVEGATDYVEFSFTTFFADNINLAFGNTAASPDIKIKWDTSQLEFNADNEGAADIAFQGSSDNMMFLDASTNRVGIGTNSPNSPLAIDQSSTTGAVPVLELNQGDVDEPFLKFIGTAAAGGPTRSLVAPAEIGGTTVAGYVKVEVEDEGNQITDQDYYMIVYTLDEESSSSASSSSSSSGP